MSVWHGDLQKKKPSAGVKHAYRKKRKFEKGCFPVETKLGESKPKLSRGRGRALKRKLLAEKFVCVTDPKKGTTQKVEIERVVENPANVDYDRRGVITKGAIVETSLGTAKITSRPGQDGILNAVIVNEKKT